MSNANATVWEPSKLTKISGNTMSVPEVFTTEAGKKNYTLTKFTYAMHTGALELYLDGKYLTLGKDWIELTDSSFLLLLDTVVAGLTLVAVGKVGISADLVIELPPAPVVPDVDAATLPVAHVAIEDITLSGLQTVESGDIANGDRVLVLGQSNAANNGIYVASTGNWEVAADWADTSLIVSGCTVLVTANSKLYHSVYTGSLVIGTTEVTFKEVTPDIPSATYPSLEAAVEDETIEVLTYIDTGSYLATSSTEHNVSGNMYLKIVGQAVAGDGCRYIPTTDGNTLVGMFPNGYVTPEHAGAAAAYNVYAGDKIAVANAVAAALNMPLVFFKPNYNMGTDSFIIDGFATSWEGRGGQPSRLYWDSVPAEGYGLLIKGEDVYEANDRMAKSFITHLNLSGGPKNSEFTASAIQIGTGASEDKVSCGSIDYVSVRGFKTTFEFTDYVWKFHITNSRTIGGVIKMPPSAWNAAVDFGECMVIRDCFFADTSNTPVYFTRGEWHILGSSFNNIPIVTERDAIVYWEGHIENPNNSLTTFKYVEVTGASLFCITKSWVPNNNRAFDEPYFISDATEGKTGGLIMRDCTYNMSGDYNVRGSGYAPHDYLVDGVGRVAIQNPHYLGFVDYYIPPVSKYTNMMANGDCESSDMSVYHKREFLGGNATSSDLVLTSETVDGSITPNWGSRFGKIQVTYAGDGGLQGLEVGQYFACKPGDIYTGGVYIRNDWDASNDAGLFQVIIYYNDALGNRKLGDKVEARVETLQNDWQYVRIGGIVPKGCTNIRTCVQVLYNTGVSNTAGTVITGYFNEFHFEIQPL